MTEDQKPIEQREGIKLMRMSKGYQWEIKLLGNPNLSAETLIILEDLDNKLRKKFIGEIKDDN